ncbi:hypothetical protein BJ508DRAFT_322012 [Ascobolus immersus RN42]|uniref:Uncharacterized protein n=1 Tax=Ascobolus immersus RN42 TaxID=1160509 RepID=A0A3N4IJM5_ASCIM|nr:hypothetical protein BJ508DRAFT_322012 [Ascobolus immersus RN42]
MLSYNTIRHLSRKAANGSYRKATRDTLVLYTYIGAASTLPFLAPALKSKTENPSGSQLSLHHCTR